MNSNTVSDTIETAPRTDSECHEKMPSEVKDSTLCESKQIQTKAKNSETQNKTQIDSQQSSGSLNDDTSSEKPLLDSWTEHNDKLLLFYVQKYKKDWKKISKKFVGQTKKATPHFLKNRHKLLCNNRYLSRVKFTHAEDVKLAKLFKRHGPDWCTISGSYDSRTPIMLKNRYYSYVRKHMDELVVQPDLEEVKPIEQPAVVTKETPSYTPMDPQQIIANFLSVEKFASPRFPQVMPTLGLGNLGLQGTQNLLYQNLMPLQMRGLPFNTFPMMRPNLLSQMLLLNQVLATQKPRPFF